ncbi:hypothetical protein, partial [Archangium sp.]|uniref:hypothetical protein n=1 Tax=Archangium sp. TaxID=1872627 RepID=UPI002ED95A45
MNNLYRMTVLQGTVSSVEPKQLRCSLHLRNGDTVILYFSTETTFSVLSNLDGVSQDRVPDVKDFEGTDLARKVARYLRPQDTVFVRGIMTENAGGTRFDVRAVTLMHSEPQRFLFEDKQWCLTQIRLMADSWLDALFGDARNYTEDDVSRYYRTNLNMYGGPTDDNLQAMPTLSRLVYGLSSAYMLTGDHRYRKAAAAAIQFQRSSFRIFSHDGQYCLWAYGRRKKVNGTVTIFASESSDDF